MGPVQVQDHLNLELNLRELNLEFSSRFSQKPELNQKFSSRFRQKGF
jgi:hypothetical protein